MAKSCAELFRGLPCTIIGNPEEEISGLAYNSSQVKPGDAFFCIVGTKVDGHSFVQDAMDHGAKVIVAERKVYLADATDVTEIIVSDSRKAMARIAARFYGLPSESFSLVGVTGTNGKTTTTFLTEHIASLAGLKTGVIGTVGISIGSERRPSERTTPESVNLQHLFADMRDANCDMVVMEVSSHALDLERTWGSKFAVTAFSNLTQDHLDYHRTFEAYFEAKARLFSTDYPAKRVICIDDEWGRELLKRCSVRDEDIITCGFDRSAQIHPVEVEYFPTHTHLLVEVRGNRYEIDYPLVGRFNVSNVMLALGIGIQLGISADVVVAALDDAPQVPGRLQRVNVANDGGVSVYVDYAHTPDALTKALDAVRQLTDGRVIVVFGCGGDRDAGKRPLMGQAALAADFAVVTSDNPRTEDPNAIIADILAGMPAPEEERYAVEPDRRAAIACAISHAKAGDVILVAGKGHEDYQLVGDKVLSFDDVKVAAEELDAKFQLDGRE